MSQITVRLYNSSLSFWSWFYSITRVFDTLVLGFDSFVYTVFNSSLRGRLINTYTPGPSLYRSVQCVCHHRITRHKRLGRSGFLVEKAYETKVVRLRNRCFRLTNYTRLSFKPFVISNLSLVSLLSLNY